MNSKEYIEQARVTDLMDYSPVLERMSRRGTLQLLHALIGLTTEVGEMMDGLKKHLFYGAPLDKVNLMEEGGDFEWYMSLLLTYLETTHDTVWEMNIEKLRKRYPNRFGELDVLVRDLPAEREILERHRLDFQPHGGVTFDPPLSLQSQDVLQYERVDGAPVYVNGRQVSTVRLLRP